MTRAFSCHHKLKFRTSNALADAHAVTAYANTAHGSAVLAPASRGVCRRARVGRKTADARHQRAKKKKKNDNDEIRTHAILGTANPDAEKMDFYSHIPYRDIAGTSEPELVGRQSVRKMSSHRLTTRERRL